MQNPVPLEELTPQILGCGNEGGAPGSAGTTGSGSSSGSSSGGRRGGQQQQAADEEPPVDDTGINFGDEAGTNEARLVSPLVTAAPGDAAPAPAPAADAQYGWEGEGGLEQMQAPDLQQLSAMMQRSQ